MRQLIALLAATAAALPAADDGAAKAVAAQLLEAMKTGEQVAQTMDAGFQRGLDAILEQAPPPQRPAIQLGVDAASRFLRTNLGWDALKDEYIALYTANFSAAELEQLLAFYRSPIGQRLVEQTPGLTARGMEIGSKRMEELMPEVQRILVDTITEAQSGLRTKKFADAGLVIGKPFPAMVLITTDGATITTSALAGKVVLIDYWATWCAPCVREVPAMIAAYQRFHDQGFEIIGISLDEDPADLSAFVAERKLPWKQSCDGKGMRSPHAQRFGIDAIPATFLIAKDGTLAAMDLRGPALAAAVEKALGAAIP